MQFKRSHEKCFVLLGSNFMLLWRQAAMDFVMEEDLKAHLTCWYIQKYVKENPHPQCFIHSSQWPCYYCGRWGRKRVSQGINNVLKHVLSSQLNIQLRTFQRLINMPISYSRDERSCSIAICEESIGSKGHMAGDRKWIGLAGQVINKICV